MSHVYNLVLVTMIGETAALAQLNARLRMFHVSNEFQQVDQEAGGPKNMECEVWLLATNYFWEDEFFKTWSGLTWRFPEDVALTINYPEGGSRVYFHGPAPADELLP